MSSSRNTVSARQIYNNTNSLVQKKLRDETSDTFQGFVKIPVDELPPLAKLFNQLSFPFKKEEDEKEPSSTHKINKTLIGPLEGNKWTHFFKNYAHSPLSDTSATIAEAEAAIGALYKFLAPGNVPTTRLYYDLDPQGKYKFVGITSKAIPNFKSNLEDPLQEQDTVVEFLLDENKEKEIINKKRILIQSLLNIIEEIDHKARIGFPMVSTVKKLCNAWLNSANVSVNFRQTLVDFIFKKNEEIQFTNNSLAQLINDLEGRRNHIIERKHHTEYKRELDLLKRAIDTANLLHNLIDRKKVTLQKVRYLELLDQKATEKKINLDAQPFQIIFIDTEDNKKISIFAKHLRNYRRIRRLTESLVARYLMQDTDGHINNMNKEGDIYDFDMAKLRFLFNIRENRLFDAQLRQPDDLTFVITERDIANFFDIVDANYYYWVTKPTSRMGSTFKEGFSKLICNIAANYFLPEHTEVFINLAKTDIVRYHSLKCFLKYALMDGSICKNYLKLHLRPHATFLDKKDNQTKCLLDEMIKDEEERISEVRRILINLPQFKSLMDLDKEFIINSLKKEFLERKTKVDNKIQKIMNGEINLPLAPFQELSNSINLGEIDKKFRRMLMAIYDKDVAQQVIVRNPGIQRTVRIHPS